MTFEEIKKFNPYHGADGRFTTGAKATSFTYKPSQGKMYDNAIVREKKISAEAARMAKPVLSAQNMPAMFRKNKPAAKSMTNFCNAINACKDADPDCVKVLSKLSTDVFDQNGVQQKVSYASNHSIITRSYAGSLREIKATIPKVPDKDNISEVATTAHELTHFADVALGGQGKTNKFSSAQNRALTDSIRANRGPNANVSDETAELFKGAYDNYKNSVMDQRTLHQQRVNGIRDKYGLNPKKDNNGRVVEYGRNLFSLPTSEFKAYQKELKASEKQMNDEIDKAIRTYGGGGVHSLSDMYDAMCGGTKSMKGTSLVVGHSTTYFNTIENRAEEMVADFVAIGVTNPKLLKHFERDYPEVFKELKNHVHKMAES